MSSNKDPQSSSAKTSKGDLLDELESIKGLLDDDLDIDIPILDDVVNDDSQLHTEASQTDADTGLLDIDRIFDDGLEHNQEATLAGSLNLDQLNPNITIPDFKLETSTVDDTENTAPTTEPLNPEDPDYEEEQEEMFAEFEMARHRLTLRKPLTRWI
ncbi:hypothetical protein [Oceanicoccus sagamiensis]|uniref:Uncharacterized protein n=1 Tax=Oceanicoccus sagamiensis TaxID=716816 RepID=A0A1X9NE95_9GAMM|nr:hypothetical protein [Oceanicoccus sagamiensis]ARN75374.1 hypothetical protein BST96_15395 [Oceanicoccus sagamiensis]